MNKINQMSSNETFHFIYFKECDVELWTNLQKKFQNNFYQFEEEFYFLYSLLQNEQRLELHIYHNHNNILPPTLRHAYKITSKQQNKNDSKMLELLQSLPDNLDIESTNVEIWKEIEVDNFPIVYSYASECRRSIYSYTKDDTRIEFVYDISKNTLHEKYYIQIKTRNLQII